MTANLPSIVSLVRKRWHAARRPAAAAAQVSVTVKKLPAGSTPPRETTVRVADHSVPDYRTTSPHAALWITQTEQYLPRWSFDDVAVRALGQASAAKGRRLYCLDRRRDLSDQVLAALSFHVDADESRPLQLIALALRIDSNENAAQSYVAAWYLLQYVAIAGNKLGRDPEVQYATEHPQAALEDLAPLHFKPLEPSPFAWPIKALVWRP